MDKGRRLAELRGTRKQKDIAAAVGVKPQAVSNWERGVTNVDNEHLEALDDALDAHGEVVAMFAPGATGVSFADIEAKLDMLRDGQVQVIAAVGMEIGRATEAVEAALAALRREVSSLRRSLERTSPTVRPRR